MKLVYPALLFCIFFAIEATAKSHKPHFNSWYPDNSNYLQGLLRNQCAKQHEFYLTNTGEAGNESGAIRPLIDCLLDEAGELITADFAAAGVLLGLLPSVLSLAGTSTMESGLLFLRRPFLALLLSAGSVSVAPMRTYEYKDPVELLQKRKGEKPKRSRLNPVQEYLMLAIEYILAAASIGNLAITSVDIGTKAVNSVSPETIWTPIIYAFLAIPCHIFGALAVWLRVKVEDVPSENGYRADESEFTNRPGHGKHAKESKFRGLLRREFSLSSSHDRGELSAKPETNLFLFISWFTSTGIILHIIYGTLILSSTLFISAKDALGVVGRFLGSTLVCRAILTYELRGIRMVVTPKKEEEEQEEDTVGAYSVIPNRSEEQKHETPNVHHR